MRTLDEFFMRANSPGVISSFTLNASGNVLPPPLQKGAIGRHHTRAEDRFQWGGILFEWRNRESGNAQGKKAVMREEKEVGGRGSLNLVAGFIAFLLF